MLTSFKKDIYSKASQKGESLLGGDLQHVCEAGGGAPVEVMSSSRDCQQHLEHGGQWPRGPLQQRAGRVAKSESLTLTLTLSWL